MASTDESALLTLGHGTLEREELGTLLTDAGIQTLVDVRRYPGSRTNPAAQQPALEELTSGLGITYRWEERLGGRRRLTKEELNASPDTWWRVTQFQAYAGWTRSPEFQAALQEVLEGVPRGKTAIMCSEAVWWRCHRRIVADVASAIHGVPVLHLMHDGRLTPHAVSAGARVSDTQGLVWDGPADPT